MANLTVTISEAIVINGAQRGSANNLTIVDIQDTFERVVTCVNSQTTTIATFAASPYTSAGAIDVDRCKYVRVTNLDSAGWIELAIQTTTSSYTVLLTPGTSHILSQAEAVALGEVGAPSFGTMLNLASIQVTPVGVSFDPRVEIFVGVAE
tara:strand:+ start:19 stop:471 length:453 start_codon:yes stop_codon:yes gene_type:complete